MSGLNPTVYVTAIVIALLLLKILMEESPEKHPTDQKPERYLDKHHFVVDFLTHASPLSSAITTGAGCLFLCWMLNYFNWLNVGDFPSTPLSPGSKKTYITETDIMNNSSSESLSAGLAYATPIFVSIAAAGIVWMSSSAS